MGGSIQVALIAQLTPEKDVRYQSTIAVGLRFLETAVHVRVASTRRIRVTQTRESPNLSKVLLVY
jgi:hypothetical protein